MIRWKTESNLKKNLDLYISKNQNFASLFSGEDKSGEIVKFWVDMALHNLPLKEEWEPENRVQKAWEHLTLYCEESCYWASFQIWKNDKSKSWEEYIFICRCFIYELNQFQEVLTKYNFTSYSLVTYIKKVLVNVIKKRGFVAKYSKWRLLQQKSDKELREALIRDGREQAEICKMFFARKYFKQVYQINKIQNPHKHIGEKWQEPDNDDFAEAAKFYNTEKLLDNAPHEVSIGANITGDKLKLWMEICIAALLKYPNSITPYFSLERLQEQGYTVDTENNFLSTPYELEDSFDKQLGLLDKIEPALQEEFFQLKPEQQKLLLIYYGLELKQSQIAERYEVTQGAIARRLQTIEIRFLKVILQLSQPSHWVTRYVSRWLVSNYSSPHHFDLIHIALVNGIKKLETQEQEILRLIYGEKMDEIITANYLRINQLELIDKLRKIISKLEFYLIEMVDELIHKYLRLWLSNTFAKMIKDTCCKLGILTNDITSSETIDFILNKSLEELQATK